MLWFGKAATVDDGGTDGEEAMMIPPHVVKIGGQEFLAGDAKAVGKFDNWVAKAKANNELIPVGDQGAHHPINSPMGRAELIKAELQVKHGLTEAEATKAVNAIPALKAPAAKPVFIFKKGQPSEESSESQPTEAVAKKSTATAKQFRGPRGKV